MNQYKRNLLAYKEATRDLSMLAHGAYTLLLDHYYATECPLPADVLVVADLLGTHDQQSVDAITHVLRRFFQLEDDGWHQAQCDEEIAKYQARAAINRAVGAMGGRPPKTRKNRSVSSKKTQSVSQGENPNGFWRENPNGFALNFQSVSTGYKGTQTVFGGKKTQSVSRGKNPNGFALNFQDDSTGYEGTQAVFGAKAEDDKKTQTVFAEKTQTVFDGGNPNGFCRNYQGDSTSYNDETQSVSSKKTQTVFQSENPNGFALNFQGDSTGCEGTKTGFSDKKTQTVFGAKTQTVFQGENPNGFDPNFQGDSTSCDDKTQTVSADCDNCETQTVFAKTASTLGIDISITTCSKDTTQPEKNSDARAQARAARGSRFVPADSPPDDWVRFCQEKRPDLDPQTVYERFTDFWIAKPGRDGLKIDWFATWRNWVRNEKAVFGAKRGGTKESPHSGFDERDYSKGIDPTTGRF